MRRVVVTGIGVVSPIGVNRRDFFQGLKNGVSGIDTIAGFDASSFPSRIAGEVRDFRLDTTLDCTPFEQVLTRDKKSAFAVQAADEALFDAFNGSCLADSYRAENVGVSLATGLEIFFPEDAAPYLENPKVDGDGLFAELDRRDPHAFLQIPADIGARIIHNGIVAEGIYCVNVSACAAGTQAVGEAFRAIQEGRADVMVTGGYDSMVNPVALGGFCKLEALSVHNDAPAFASRPFDIARDGFVLGEGAAILVLEEREAALRRGASLYAEILGYASSLDAFRVTDPAEDQAGAVTAMRGALYDAGLSPGDIDYINAHGTGTRKNDPAETAAIREVFGVESERVPVSATKSQIGHLIGAAGAVELAAGIFSLLYQMVPATISLQNPDPSCCLHHVAGLPQAARVERVLSNSFGFGGQNASIVAARASG